MVGTRIEFRITQLLVLIDNRRRLGRACYLLFKEFVKAGDHGQVL